MNSVEKVRLDKTVFDVVSLAEEGDDREYWSNRSTQERMEALELLRQIVYGYDPAITRLQRVLRLLNSNDVQYLVIGGYAVNFF